MSSTFSTSTRVTLFFPGWTTNSPAAYVGSLIFLIFIAMANRYLGALKTQLERSWVAVRSPDIKKHHRSRSRREANYSSEANESEAEPLSPYLATHMHSDNDDAGQKSDANDIVVERAASRSAYLPSGWVSNGAWSLSRDGTRALLEFLRAFIGYILMLAVMTFNVGFLFAVLGGVLFGELILGRYTTGVSSGWQEGACHE
ncbi:hypothetical protein EJ05DRAFT_503938 [Pseudovirgaria hyperparasitica]|uniref:Copper transport protein n=1 Tax=Pseudovirgaria hyperparasitica TaxID=470096 RepID=A0A6A6VV11_9PEZI|nr:uncharacterized protein EJ05DRAFT_503938 [Pseudovirgaria hyperparasitica]KAF2754402.1 hypothetical protein EJ05DRAFT_503938 [Pseudovirgaria hyperparasitica]